MTIKQYIKISAVLLISLTACTDLELKPKGSASSDVLLTTPEGYRQFLAKIYAGLTTSGQNGPAGAPDIRTGDEGFSQYIRGLWHMETFPTDEAVTRWGDPGLKDYHAHNWTSQNPPITQFYYRIYYQIAIANEFLRESTDEKLESRGLSSFKSTAAIYRAEARFLRALSYWHALNYFRNVPFVDENSSTDAPPQATPQRVFDFVESELKAIESIMLAPKANEYGRADRAAAWTLLAKLYLNAEVYLGVPKYTECITYCKKVIDSEAFELDADYQHVFLADNHLSTEIIFGVPQDGLKTISYGGVTAIINGANGGTLAQQKDADGRNTILGTGQDWAGHRTTKAIVNLFAPSDTRAKFWTNGQNLEINDINEFSDGLAVTKFRNVDRDGIPGKDPGFADTDFPLFRLADVYLMYAEAVVRGGTGGSIGEAVALINQLRERAFSNYPVQGQVTAADLNDVFFILDERGRELYWEAHRRTDMVRFKVFADNPTNNPRGVWPWKGNVRDGVATQSFRNVFPIPASDIIANRNLKQNDGY
jgi:starch-binding outer membrane protein, SusD/RagB family